MSSRPWVSAIIIFLNAAQFIQEAIESVFAQTYDHWELLLVDDGSTDGSTAIALRYAHQYPQRVCYLEHPGHQNLGMSASRNLGISNAKGAYIAFVDADDVWLPSKLEQQVAVLDSQPEAGMVYAPTLYWYSWTGNPEDRARDYVPKLGLEPHTLVKPPTLLTLFLREEAKPPGTCSVLLRREVIEDVGGFVERFRGLYEDQAFFAKVCLRVPVFVVGEHSARYRQHPHSCCAIAAHTGAQAPAELQYLHWLAEYVCRQVQKDGEAWSVLAKLLWPYRHPLLCCVFGRAQQLVKQGKELQMKALVRAIARRTLPVHIRRWH
jgi:hypothetical protein